MSKWPWPDRLKNSVFFSPLSLQRIASSIQAAMAWLDSGGGDDAFGTGKGYTGLKVASCGTATASISFS